MSFCARSGISLYMDLTPDTPVQDPVPSEAEMMDTQDGVVVHQTLNNLRNEAQFTDALLVVGQKSFNVHRVLLAAHSSYFRDLFTKEKELSQIELEGTVDPDIMESILLFMYTHDIHLGIDNARLTMETQEDVVFHQILNNLRNEAQFTDAVLVVGHRTFNVHRVLLAAHSPYLTNLFTKEKEQSRIELEGTVDPDIMELILLYIYTHKVHLDMDNVNSVIAQADIFLLSSLVELGCNFLRRQLVVENCINIYRFAAKLNKQELAHASKFYILRHFHKVALHSSDFLELTVDELIEFIQDDYLNVRGEEVVFEAAVRWVEHKETERIEHLPRLLAAMRLGLIARENFHARVRDHRLIQKNWEICADHIQCVDQFLEDTVAPSTGCALFCSHTQIRPRIPRDVIFAVGGWSGEGPISLFETYDARADKWYKHDPFLEDRARAYHATVALDHDIYVIGGFDGMDYFSSVKKFDAIKKTCHEVSPMHDKRCYVSATVLNGSIYAMGGYNGYSRLHSAERYDPEDNQWNKIANMHSQRSDAGASAMAGCVYIVGGFNGLACLDTAESYSPDTDQWTVLTGMSTARRGVSLVTYYDCIYALGGFDGKDRLKSVEKYCAVTRRWTSVPDMNNQRSNFTAVVMDGMIFVAGGFNGITTIPHVECYDPVTEEWFDATDMNIGRSALQACVLRDLPNVTEYTHHGHSSSQKDKGSTDNNNQEQETLPPVKTKLD